MSNGVLIVGEVVDGALHPTVRQLVNAADRVADASEVTLCLAVGGSFDDGCLEGVSVGEVILLEHPDAISDEGGGVYSLLTELACDAMERVWPSVVLVAKTDAGSVISARIAARFDAGLASDCIDLALNSEGRVAVTRPVHGGSAMAVYEFSGDGLQVVSVRPGAFEPAPASADMPEVERVDVSGIGVEAGVPVLVETVLEEGEGIPLEQADVVVSGGRGLGGPEPFDNLRELCGLLNAALGASRAACDAGWIDHSHQVGLTGKSISPTTYITVGISGASQHMAGCSSARNIVAIDKDREANIFSHARYGVVGDWAKVLPAFTAAVAELD
ncbi:MAG: electron transfer flavoprotein subunit alpha/FixB family protein [Chloroflexi bacterium]|nr:electron transfer flavoprotein subunit alpha/FixB family protein [Chloroflexota bacterium]